MNFKYKKSDDFLNYYGNKYQVYINSHTPLAPEMELAINLISSLKYPMNDFIFKKFFEKKNYRQIEHLTFYSENYIRKKIFEGKKILELELSKTNE